MAVFNGQQHLEGALKSICRQTFTDWELVAVDDASTDRTAVILDEFAAGDPRVSVIHCEHNLGQAACLNIGWHQSRADLVARMDADDISLPTRLERQVEFMDRHPSVSVLGTGAVLIDDAGSPLRTAIRPEDHELLVRHIYKETPFFHPSVLIRRRFLAALDGYSAKLRRAQDLDLWLRGCRLFHYHNLTEPLIEYRIPTRLSWRTLLEGSFVLARSAYRERTLLGRGWYAPRYFLAALLAKLGLRQLSFD
jgi:glycosyltransferase involved in cell wall biosynthesis